MTAFADTIITNGRILTMDPDRPTAEAIAIAGGNILAVGSSAEIGKLRGPDTTVFDAGGNSVLPGFIEAHMHLFGGAAELENLHLFGLHGFDAMRDAIQEFAATRRHLPLIIGAGADYTILSEQETVTRHHLDRIIPDQPFAMSAPDHHTMWANTIALEQAGVLHGAKLGPGNEIVMGEDGLATGELRESEAFAAVMKLAGAGRERLGLSTGGEPDPYPTEEELARDRAILKRGLDWCARHGITSIQNMDGNLYQLQLLAAIEAEGELLCRTKIPFHFKNFMSVDILAKASAMGKDYASEWLSSGMVKVFMDGVLDNWTAVMLESYADRPDWVGEPLFTQAQFDELAVEADRRGLQIAVHAIGDGAVRSVLDGYEAARKANGARDSRHRVEHIEVISEADIPRFAELGVIASMQPPHPPGAMGFPLEPTISRIGRARWPLSYAWRTMKNAGAHVVFASDWPVSPIDPMSGIQAAVTRKPWAETDPDQSFSLHEAIAGYTVEGAFAEFAEDRKGQLKPGFMADIVILSGNVEAAAPHELHTVRPVTTICGGKVTFQA
jgi:predicted amidohydrolase YtcJ